MLTRQGTLALREYVAHHLLGTPLESPARFIAELPKRWSLQKHPELEEVYLESDRIHQLMAHVLTPTMNCIDIGCHIGSMLQKMHEFAPNGQHMAIEPIPYKANWLKQKFPQAEILQIALNDCTGDSSFFVHKEQSGYSGLRLHAPAFVDTAAVADTSATSTIEELQVECHRLDDVVPIDRSIGFIKVDVEGAELNVLRGGQSLLDRCHPLILFECTLTTLETFDTQAQTIYDFLIHQGYAVYLIKDYLANGKPLTYSAFDRAMHYPFAAFNFVAVVD